MKRAAQALAVFLDRVVGVEGAFLLLGTILLAVGSGFLTPAGPWFVIGGISLAIGLALAMPRRS